MSRFCELSLQLLLGDAVAPALEQGRVVAAQCISGTGGLRVAGEFLKAFGTTTSGGAAHEIYMPDPTWGNHGAIFKKAGLAPKTYRYLDESEQE